MVNSELITCHAIKYTFCCKFCQVYLTEFTENPSIPIEYTCILRVLHEFVKYIFGAYINYNVSFGRCQIFFVSKCPRRVNCVTKKKRVCSRAIHAPRTFVKRCESYELTQFLSRAILNTDT